MKKSDADLNSDVFDELDFDPALNASLITINVNHGAVTLSGSVPTYWQKQRADDDARRVYGVRSVANYLVVAVPSLYYRDDDDIAAAARSALAWHSDLPDSIGVAVDDGWLTLSGQVDWDFQRQEAENAVEYLSGVKGVFNNITLIQRPKAMDVQKQIKNELERIVAEEAQNINVDTSNGRVTLSGFVNSWSEDEAARRASWSVPGVTAVDDNLVVGAV
jgi:osmotically-inducible protein OsmY